MSVKNKTKAKEEKPATNRRTLRCSIVFLYSIVLEKDTWYITIEWWKIDTILHIILNGLIISDKTEMDQFCNSDDMRHFTCFLEYISQVYYSVSDPLQVINELSLLYTYVLILEISFKSCIALCLYSTVFKRM